MIISYLVVELFSKIRFRAVVVAGGSEKGEIDLIYEPMATMTADVLTKALPKDRH